MCCTYYLDLLFGLVSIVSIIEIGIPPQDTLCVRMSDSGRAVLSRYFVRQDV
jgi:hypothetical protein